MKRLLFAVLIGLLVLPQLVFAQKKTVFGWITFDNTKWDAPYSNSNAMIPADSLPWGVLTHAGLFATNGTVPCAARYAAQYPYFALRAHKSGVYAGLTIGGSGDGGFATFIGNSANWPAWFAEYLPRFDAAKMDFFEFDLEGSYNTTTLSTFIHQLYDSLQTRSCGNNASEKPFIVLTVGSSRANSWVSWAKPYVKFVNIMSYDYAQQGTWGRLVFDCAPISYQYYNGTGTNTDYFAGQGVNSPAPSMQQVAKRAVAAGWAADQVIIGFDAMPAHYWGGNFSGRGPTYIREPESASTTPVSVDGSNPTIASMWNTLMAIPKDSIRFDQIAQAYWAHTGTDLASDQLYTFTTLPGMEGSIAATRKMVDSMGVGVSFWNLGEEVWRTPVVPEGGRGWFFSQIKKYFDYGNAPPPPVDSDGDGVIDANDLCPNTPIGTVVDATGCPVIVPPADSDKDGVIDSKDLCPGTPIGTTVDTNGCPIVLPPLDTDKDGVPDNIDNCPTVAGPASNNGCPIPPPTTYGLDLKITGDYANGASYLIDAIPSNIGTMDVKVQFFNNGTLYSTENGAPYQMFGDNIYKKLGIGVHTVIAKLFAQNGTSVLAADTLIFEERSGTPPPPPVDSDGDGVTDDKDLCPGTPAGTTVDATGCSIIIPPPPSGGTFIYENDKLTSPWIYSGWGTTRTYTNASPAIVGTSIKVVANAWGSMGVHSGNWGVETKLYTDSYSELYFQIYSTAAFQINVYIGTGSGWNSTKKQITLVANTWNEIRLPMSTFVTANHVFYDIQIQNWTGSSRTFYIDNLKLIPKTATFKTSFSAEPEILTAEPVLTDLSVQVASNPTNPTFVVRIGIPESGSLNIGVYDVLGRLVEERNTSVEPGAQYSYFDAANLSSGTYFLKITLNASKVYQKMSKVLIMK